MRKGQTSLEFMLLVAFLLFFFVSFLVVLGFSMSDRTYERQSLTLQSIARTIQDEVAFAHMTSDGYERVFSLPVTLVSLEYVIDIIGSDVYIHTVNGKHALSVPILPVNGTLFPGSNTLRRSDGVVYANS